MPIVNFHRAKLRLYQLISGNNKPKPKWGLAKGKFEVPDNIDAQNAEIEALFNNNKI